MRSSTNGKCFHMLFAFQNMTFCRLKRKPFRCKNMLSYYVTVTVIFCRASFINFNVKHTNFVKYSRSLYRFSDDTRATKLVNNRFLEVYTCSVLMIFKQYTLNGERRVSNSKHHVIQRKQTNENVCSLCLNANNCM